MRIDRHQLRLVVLVACFGALLCEHPAAGASDRPPYPVILIHGIFANEGSWDGFKDALIGPAHGWTDGGVVTTSTTSPPIGDFYRVHFSSSSGLTFDEQALELSAIVATVRNVNAAPRVILVGHSMGGVAARRYLQFHSPIPADVAALIMIGTPNTGSDWANPRVQGLLSAVHVCVNGCTALDELQIGSDAYTDPVNGLNAPINTRACPTNASPRACLPRDVMYTAIVVTATENLGLFREDGDGIVTAASQKLSTVASGLPLLTEPPISIDLPLYPAHGCDDWSNSAAGVFLAEVHTCEPGDASVQAAILSAVHQTAVPPELALTLNKLDFYAGDTLHVGLRVTNPGLPFSTDFYFGHLWPDGQTITFYTSLSPVQSVIRRVSEPGTFPPIVRNVQIPQGTDASLPDVLVATFPQDFTPGEYTLFAAMTFPGTLNLTNQSVV